MGSRSVPNFCVYGTILGTDLLRKCSDTFQVPLDNTYLLAILNSTDDSNHRLIGVAKCHLGTPRRCRLHSVCPLWYGLETF